MDRLIMVTLTVHTIISASVAMLITAGIFS